MKPQYILALDQGTTGSRAFIFDSKGQIVTSDYKEFKQYFPKPGWVEHDAEEIWRSCTDVIKGALRKSRVSPGRIAAIGVTTEFLTVKEIHEEKSRHPRTPAPARTSENQSHAG